MLNKVEDDDDIDILARTLYGEAEAGNRADAQAIANVIMNRVKLRNWPDDISEVCLQPFQFSCWNSNDPGRARIMKASTRDPWFKTCSDLAMQAAFGGLRDVTHRSTHYYATYVSVPKWAKKGNKKPVYTVKHRGGSAHLFFNNIDTPPPKTAKDALNQVRPLYNTKEVQGASVATAGVGGTVIIDVLNDIRNQIEPLTPFMDTLRWLFIGVILLGIGVTIWSRFYDRKRGIR